MSTPNAKLRELRLKAVPAISGPEMADELGFDSRQAYYYYESEGPKSFKERQFPLPLTRRIADILSARGVDHDEVMALAGFEDRNRITSALTPGQQKWLDLYEELSIDQRSLVKKLIREILGFHDDRREPSTILHQPAGHYRAPGHS